MLETLKFKKSVITKWKSFSLKKKIWILVISVLVLLFFTEFSPLHFLWKFLVALADVASDFNYNISRNVRDVNIILWTSKNKTKSQVLLENSVQALAATDFNKSHPIKILIHGFSDKANTMWTRAVKNAYLAKGDYNVFSVNWEPLAISPWYTTAVKNARHVGEFTASFIYFLMSEDIGVPWSSFHVIGASLGGQAAGHVGYFTNGHLPRITGLDPSGPLFHSADRAFRLDPTDAQFVDVIHSAGKWVGNDDVMGHADFFPNLGQAPQPGCEERESLDLSCSHFMSWRWFAKSLKKDTIFYALKCQNERDFTSGNCCMNPKLNASQDVVIMGEDVDTSISGKFYLYTNGENPKATKEESISCDWV